MESEHTARFILQVAVIILAAKLLGGLCSRYLKQPSVLGELVAGMLIGPFALGGKEIFGVGPPFPVPLAGQLPVSSELHSLALLASAVLLFLAGLETDLRKFLRYAFTGLCTGLGGAVLSFALGDAVVVWTGYATSYLSPEALFMGTVATATSVGLTARVLSEKRKMDTAEGASILSGAVIDDIIGLVLLAMVLSVAAKGAGEGGALNWGGLAWIAGKAGIFWIVTMAVGILGASYLATFLKAFGGSKAAAIAALGLAFLLAALAQKAGLALIIGAYTMGISLSQIDRAHQIQDRLTIIHEFLVPIFFCTMGMMVDFSRIGSTIVLGLLFTVACVVGKVLGCAAAAWPLGFNARGAARIGVGMMPRQEVALIVAGVGLTSGAIGPGIFGAAVIMTFLTSLAAPGILAWLFNEQSGLRRREEEPPHATEQLRITLPSERVAQLMAERLVDAFRQEQFFVHHRAELGTYEMRKQKMAVYLNIEDEKIVISTAPATLQYVRFIILEEMIALRDVFREASDFGGPDQFRHLLLGSDKP